MLQHSAQGSPATSRFDFQLEVIHELPLIAYTQ